jgi:hypothetical protein
MTTCSLEMSLSDVLLCTGGAGTNRMYTAAFDLTTRTRLIPGETDKSYYSTSYSSPHTVHTFKLLRLGTYSITSTVRTLQYQGISPPCFISRQICTHKRDLECKFEQRSLVIQYSKPEVNLINRFCRTNI